MANQARTNSSRDPQKDNIRGPRSATADNRTSRAMQDREVTEDRSLSDDERVEMFRQQFFQSALPDLPKIPGYHTCWLTTTNPRDTVQTRIRLGYELIRNEDIPGWDYVSIKTGDYVGCVGVNEMVAAKLPLELYHRFMKEAHHNEPLAQEEMLRNNLEQLREDAAKYGGRLQVGDGDQALGDDDRPPRFDDDRDYNDE